MFTSAKDFGANGDRVKGSVVILDVAESVRMIEADEAGTLRRWRRLTHQVKNEILPASSGRLVESRGDALVLQFSSALQAVRSAIAVRQLCDNGINSDASPSKRMLLRIGVHTGEFIAGEHDIQGRAVNLAARLLTLAGPGEIVVSADVRDRITPVLDADVEDLGECYLKHFDQPVHAFRVGPPGPSPLVEPTESALGELRPTIAVIPFVARNVGHEHDVLGEVIADELIAALSRTAELNVISRLTTTALRDRVLKPGEAGAMLSAGYVLSGAYSVDGDELRLLAELGETKTGHVVFARSFKGHVSGLVSGADEMIDRLVADVSSAVIKRELTRARSNSLPTLASYTLLLGAIVMMHRASARDFELARQRLEALVERLPRQAVPHAWLAMWHVLRFNRGWSLDQQAEAQQAMACTRRALSADPANSLALTVDGFVHTNLLKRLDEGAALYDQALQANPNESLAWLLKGTLHAFKGEGASAMEATAHALRLSPLDPLRYFYESLSATAALAAENYPRAIELARRSLRVNRVHTSSLRALTIAQALLGRVDEARSTAVELLRVEPALTVTRFLARSPSAEYDNGKRWAEALKLAGIPN